jgi:hypothetical protein
LPEAGLAPYPLLIFPLPSALSFFLSEAGNERKERDLIQSHDPAKQLELNPGYQREREKNKPHYSIRGSKPLLYSRLEIHKGL